MKNNAPIHAFALVASFAFGSLAFADAGHDHGPAPAASSPASPRFEATSDLFELVGVLEKGQLTVYLDRFATNEPVAGAKVEFESGATKGVAAPQPDGTYAIQLAGLEKPGQFPFAFTVTAGADTDLLAGELVVAGSAPAATSGEIAWRRWTGIGAGVLLAVALAASAARRLSRRHGRAPT